MAIKNDDEGVSPVIGVILMVAITVILAAVVAAFVFGLGGNIQKTKMSVVTAYQPNQSTIVLTYQGGQETTLEWINVTIVDSHSNPPVTKTMGTIGASSPLIVGTTKVFTGPYEGKDHVIAVGFYGDGTRQVLLDTVI